MIFLKRDNETLYNPILLLFLGFKNTWSCLHGGDFGLILSFTEE